MTQVPPSAPAPPPTQQPPTPAPPPRKRRRGVVSDVPPVTRRAQARLGIVLVAPLFLLVATFMLFPMANAIYYVFVDFNGIDLNPPWVGLANFAELGQDPKVWAAFRNNLIWIVLGTVAPVAIGLVLAVLVWNIKRGGKFYRTVFFLPYVLPHVAIGIVWGWIYDPSRGWLNRALEALGLDGLTRGWLGDPSTAIYAVLATAIWAYIGFVFVIFLSALRNVDVDMVDAALIDGANPAQRLRHVILPQIMPVFLMATTITLIGGFAVFDIVFVMTGGGPAGASEVLGTYAYSAAFQLNRISYGTTLALVITLMAVPLAVALNRVQRKVSMQGTGA